MIDLSGPRAKLKWADAQMVVLDSDLRAFFERKPYRLRENVHPDRPDGKDIILEMIEPIPDTIRVSVGAILKSQRDSLDHLAVALAEKNGAVEPKDVYFPITDSSTSHALPATQKKIRRLSTGDQAVINGLKPYKGGNDALFALNFLANKDKHRKLLVAMAQLGGWSITAKPDTAGGYVRRIAIFLPDNSAYPGSAFAFFDADPDVDFNLSAHIAFGEAGDTYGKPVVEVLNDFGRLAESIINLF